MKKKGNKLKEKPARIPDLFEKEKTSKIKDYLKDIVELQTEPAKATRFIQLLKDLFEDISYNFVKDYLKGIEKYVRVKEGDILLRGRIDALFGNLVIEFERDLMKSLSEAKDQLKKYIACLWSDKDERKINYLCVATDGINFCVFSPRTNKLPEEIPKLEDIMLDEIEKVDFSTIEPYRIYFWLDRYFFRERILPPKTEEFVTDFGIRSYAFKFCFNYLNTVWQRVKTRSDLEFIYENWEKYLRITYGTALGSEELFIRHIYLATLAKLMVWMRLSGKDSIPSEEEIVSILDGEFFRRQRIASFLEEDFFSWIARKETKIFGLDISKKLINQLSKYNLRELSEDVLKALYQELVDPQTRHDLGEYYTPDWLAQRMVKRALTKNPEVSVLDPACGSGTFLYMIIKAKREMLGDSVKTLDHILQTVVGIDIHPLAAIITKTNYLLALGDLFKKRKKRMEIPIYLANSIKLPEKDVVRYAFAQLPSYRWDIANKEVFIPEVLIQDSRVYDEVIEICKEFAKNFAGIKKELTTQGLKTAFLNFLTRSLPQISSDERLANTLFHLAKTMKELIEEEHNTILAFVLKNLYKPLFLKKKFDIILGNPPWLSYRYVERGDYQKFLKDQIVTGYKLLSRKPELITQMELGTLFFVRSADLYLKEGGTIGFVLPRSVFTADQHDAFRRGSFSGNLSLQEIWDLEKIKPLFNVPACVVFAEKGGKTKDLLNSEIISGQLKRKNASLQEAEKALNFAQQQLFLGERGGRTFLTSLKPSLISGLPSVYKSLFKNGATIYPGPFWFVEIGLHPKFGFDSSFPYIRTAESAIKKAKEGYKGIKLEGNIERDFLYATLLSSDIISFGHLAFRLVVLPILPKAKGYTVLKEYEARKKGYLNLAQWLEKVQKEWEERRREKREKMDACESLDYRRKLSMQTRSKYTVLYPASGTYLCGCVLENKPISMQVEEQEIETQGFLVDCRLFYYDTQNADEAYYLTAILNSSIIDELIKPMQAKGGFGPRHIHKKLWEIPIPQFDPSKEGHRALSELSIHCTQKVKKILSKGLKYQGIGYVRKVIKKELETEIQQIDKIVSKILKFKV